MKETADPAEWYRTFRRQVRQARWADPLRESALAGRLRKWTGHLTGAVVATCQALGWTAVARGHLAEVLPVPRQEYLAVDVMAFPPADRPGWRWPVAAFELENRPDLDAVSYSVWKVSVVRCAWGAVFCYRRDLEEIGGLLRALADGVMDGIFRRAGAGHIPLPPLLLVVGTRSRAEDFPDGFFQPYLWDSTAGRFRQLW